MDLRHEWKHRINVEDLILLRQRLRLLAKPDPYAVGGDAIISAASISIPLQTKPCGEAGWGQWPGEVSYPLLQQRLLFDSSGEEKQAEWFGS